MVPAQDKAEGGTSKQPDKAAVTKERKGGWSPTQETLRIIKGGVQSFRPTHPDPPCGDTWVCHVVIAVKRIAQAAACTAKKRSRLITNRNDRS